MLVDFSQCESDAQAVAFMITAEEYGGKGRRAAALRKRTWRNTEAG